MQPANTVDEATQGEGELSMNELRRKGKIVASCQIQSVSNGTDYTDGKVKSC